MIVDSHVHLYHRKFADDQADVIVRAHEAGVTTMLLPAIDVDSMHQALALADAYPGVHPMAGLHPSDVKDATEQDWEEVVRLSADPRMVAVGETGLDYYWDTSYNDKQHDFLRRHIRLAVERGLPLVFHNRDSSEDLVRIVQEEQAALDDPSRIFGVFHCFGGPEWMSEAVMELGFHVGIGGTFTFKNGGVPDAVRDIPMDRILLETDAPFLAPTPLRGKRNEPANTRLVAVALAEDRGLSLEEVAAVTSENARRLFRLPEH